MNTTYRCEGCGATFTGTPQEAFHLGWDTPERFMSHCTCPRCPINTTAWWRIVVEKQQPTRQDLLLIKGHNALFYEHRDANR